MFAVLQVVFLINSDINGQLAGNIEQNVSLLRLACLRILSAFKYNRTYKQLRWGFRLYSLDSLPLTAHRHTNWKEFSLQTFEDFEETLGK